MKKLFLILIATPAHADVCRDALVDPPPTSLRDGGFDAPRSACLRADVDARLDARALIDTPDFHGALDGDLRIGVSLLEPFGLEWGASVRVVDYTFAQTAVVTATEPGYGPISVHAALGHARGDLHLAGQLGFELPFTRSELDESAAGAQLAALATWAWRPRLALHGRAALLGWYGSSAGGTSTRAAGVISADAAVRATCWLEAFGGLETEAGWYGGLDHVAARVGAGARVATAWRIDAGAIVPFAGDEKTNAMMTIGVRVDR